MTYPAVIQCQENTSQRPFIRSGLDAHAHGIDQGNEGREEGKKGGRGRECTHERPNGSQELRLHRLLLREPAPDQNTVVGDFVGDFVGEAGEGGGCADEGGGVE